MRPDVSMFLLFSPTVAGTSTTQQCGQPHLIKPEVSNALTAVQFASSSSGPELLLHQQNFLSVAFLIRFTDLSLADVRCTNLESSRLYMPPKMRKWTNTSFLAAPCLQQDTYEQEDKESRCTNRDQQL